MRLDQLTITDKWQDVLDDDSQVIFLEGPSQTSKTTLVSVKSIWDLFAKSKRGETVVYLCGESTNTIYRNFVEKETSITKVFPYMTEYIGDTKRGGERIEVIVPYEENGKTIFETKKLYFVGYKTIASEEKLLGSDPFMIIADEINKAHDTFVTQIFTRVAATGCKLLATTNGDVPDKLIYKYLNACRPHAKYMNDVPHSTMAELINTEPKDNWRYYFFKLLDRPIPPDELTMDEWIKQMMNSHPVGSFSYNAFVLGIRGYTEGALFGYLIKEEHTVDESKINYDAIVDVYIGMDVGSGVEGETQARTVAIPVAHSRGYQRSVVLDGWLSNEAEHIKVLKELEPKLQDLQRRFSYKVRAVYIDSAERTMINTFRNNKRVPIAIESSIKFTKYVNATSRVSLKEQMLLGDRLLFANNEGAQMVKENLMRVKGKNGEVVDENMLHNDINDALDYGLTPKFNELMNSKRG